MNWATQAIRYAVRTGICPMCGLRPRARWKDDNSLRITCGHPDCFRKWMPGSREIVKTEGFIPIKQEE